MLDDAMLEAGKSQPLLFHPMAGNHLTVEMDAAALLAYFDRAGHTPMRFTFPDREAE